MVAEGPKTGVVESFYDFFAQLYSSSFTANQPWPSSFLGSSALEGPVPRGDDRGLENQPPWEAPNRKAERGQSPQPRGSLVPGNERCPKPHPLEYGWPEDEFHTPMKPPKVTSPSPHGFPDPMEPSARGREPQAARELQAAREPREPRESQHDREREAKEWMRQRERECQESEMKFKEAPRSRREEASQEPRRKERKERRERKEGEEPYKAEPEDLIDQHVAYFLRKNPQVRPRHKIQRRSPGVYLLDSRDVQIEWQYATEPGGQGFLVVVDGPLRQPFSDYMMDTEENATYDGQDIVQSNLHLIARDRRISFNDTHKVYNRLEAMKVAKEQALVREKAASYVKDGRDVPQDLMARYKKTIQVKLGLCRPKGVRPTAEEVPSPQAQTSQPAPAPPTPEPPSPQPPPPPSPAPRAHGQSAGKSAGTGQSTGNGNGYGYNGYSGHAARAEHGKRHGSHGNSHSRGHSTGGSHSHTPHGTSAPVPPPAPPVGRMHSGQGASYAPSPKPSARPVADAGGSATPGLPVPPPLALPVRQWAPNPVLPVLLGAGTPTAAGPYKTQPGAWRSATPRTPSGGFALAAWPQTNLNLPAYQRVR